MKSTIFSFLFSVIALASFAQVSNDVYTRAEVMPVYKECANEQLMAKPYFCTINQLMEEFKSSINVPNPIGKETKGLLSFVVNTDGSITDIQLERGVFVRIEDEAQKQEVQNFLDNAIVELANTLSFNTPGYQDGEAVKVKVQFSVPVNY